jgi:uncharacterized protein YggE
MGTLSQHGGMKVKLNAIALAALMGFGAASVQASELPDSPHIVTSGTASVDAVPDIATLAIEVNVAAKDAASAKKQADDRVAQYLSFLEQNGVGKKDINSANLRTQPVLFAGTEQHHFMYRCAQACPRGFNVARAVIGTNNVDCCARV